MKKPGPDNRPALTPHFRYYFFHTRQLHTLRGAPPTIRGGAVRVYAHAPQPYRVHHKAAFAQSPCFRADASLKSHHIVGRVGFLQIFDFVLGKLHVIQPDDGLLKMTQLGSPQNRRGDGGL